MKAALVLGSASCLYEDMAMAKAALTAYEDPDPVLFGVNMVCEYIEVHHVVTHHAEYMLRFQRKALGNPKFHTRERQRGDTAVDGHGVKVWPISGPIHGTSSMLAVRIARASGHMPVILCGVPLAPVGYLDGYPQPKSEFHPEKPKNGTIESWRDSWRAAYEGGYLTGVYSASGWTRELLGWLPQT